jgi:hypothetical protein
VYINGIHHHGNSVLQYCFQIIQSPENHCAKNLPQLARKVNDRAVVAWCLPRLRNITKVLRLFDTVFN